MKEDGKRERLIALGPEVLADALQGLAVWQENVAYTVERLTSTPEENIKRYRRALSRVRHREYASGVRSTSAYANELTEILADLVAARLEPRSGVEAIADFYRADGAIFEVCDDSYGNIGDVFFCDAVEIFANYASRYNDEAWVIDVVIGLNQRDDYCVRCSLFERAADYLSEPGLREFVARLWKLAGDAAEDRNWIRVIETLARQLKDAKLFERARRASKSGFSVRDCEEVARFYHETGDSETALSWLRRNPEVVSTIAGSSTDLLLAIHRKLGNRKEMAEAAWQLFHRHRAEDTLTELLEIIGNDRREKVIFGETKRIYSNAPIS